jgi:hypothetical protein
MYVPWISGSLVEAVLLTKCARVKPSMSTVAPDAM